MLSGVISIECLKSRVSCLFGVRLRYEKCSLVLETSDTVDNLLRRLTTIEVARDLSVGLLTLVTTS